MAKEEPGRAAYKVKIGPWAFTVIAESAFAAITRAITELESEMKLTMSVFWKLSAERTKGIDLLFQEGLDATPRKE